MGAYSDIITTVYAVFAAVDERFSAAGDWSWYTVDSEHDGNRVMFVQNGRVAFWSRLEGRARCRKGYIFASR
jgi:hypothetical protein